MNSKSNSTQKPAARQVSAANQYLIYLMAVKDISYKLEKAPLFESGALKIVVIDG